MQYFASCSVGLLSHLRWPRRVFDSIPTLTALASKQGFLEEKHFADAGLWQTEEEKEAEEKNPRDDLALYRQRAILLTSAGFRARTEARRKELETNRRAKEDKKKDEKEQAERKKFENKARGRS